ncbi:MOSC domain-containing protein YiiM [Pseudomonas delhiensis]|uniref:MOSC domain-containing protein YiiM n=1 Tax=Pseudomonas delhiensis TaxID=366289 RepID=A0A239LIB9_9PSED|nr:MULTISPECIES: MOSC domain-containing protein [Pseudomonas]SDJ24014.1 MOSC domain-containing protein YiiM [Pseudomonas delhiensis]SNT29583.1 MOSC domain-containing protein YiiM [Pseudomonas delhiensis]
MEGIVIQGVFIGKVEECWGGLVSAIDKLETREEVWLGSEGLPGDEQADLRHHGGLDRALHHYPAEHYRHWRKQHPQQRWQQPAFGENLSTFGVNEADVCIGDLFRWGEALIEVSQPRSPCYRLGRRWNLPELPLELQQQGRCGWFYRVRRAGMVSAAAPLELVQRHYPQLSVASLLRWYFGEPLEPCGLRQMMACDALSLRWRKTAAQRLASGVVEDWTARLQGPECLGSGPA